LQESSKKRDFPVDHEGGNATLDDLEEEKSRPKQKRSARSKLGRGKNVEGSPSESGTEGNILFLLLPMGKKYAVEKPSH